MSALFEGKWTPGPDLAELNLLDRKMYMEIIVWRSLLRIATTTRNWEISYSIATIQTETKLAKGTIIKACKNLRALEYYTVISGGGKTCQKTTIKLKKPTNYDKPKPNQESWEL